MIARWLAGLAARLKALRPGRFEAEMDEELRFHIDEATRRNVERGMDPDKARRAAHRQFGGMGAVEATKDDVRRETGVRLLRDAGRDFRHAARGIRRHPAFAAVAAITLALGIGANTAVFSAVDSVLLSPLPYPGSGRLVKLLTVWEGDPEGSSILSGLDFLDFREEVEAFETLAGVYTYQEQGVDLMGPDGPVRLRALPIGAGYFETYRATPALGRTFTRAEEVPDALVTILSHRAWRTIANGDPDVLGRSLTLDGLPYTVVGVMRPSFMDVVAGDVDLWIPQNLAPGGFNSRANMYLAAIGRLEPGASVEQAQAQVDAVTARIHEEFPEEDWRTTRVVPLIDEVVEGAGTMLYILLGASGLVLLIACVNVANLALARGTARQGELAVRLALGSGRGRLVRQLVTESLVVAAIGGLAGLLLAIAGLQILIALGPETVPRAEEIGFDGSLLAFAVLVTAVTGLIFGLVPALGLTRSGLAGAVREDARGASVGRTRTRLRSGLVAAQVALAVMLLFGAGVLMRSFLNLQRVDTGIRTDDIATFEVHLPETRYTDAESRVRVHRELNDRLSRASGIEAAGATSWLPLMGEHNQWGLRWEEEGGFAAQVRVIEGAYLDAFGIPLVAGRGFQRTDVADTDPVALMNETAARLTYGDPAAALGRSIRIGPGDWTVVGIVADVAHSPRGDVGPRIYFPHAQFGSRDWGLSVVLSSPGGVGPALAAARRELAEIDPALVLYRPRAFSDVAAAQIARERFAFTLMGVFAAIALVLATVGLYGVLSYVVSQRVREFGIRMALGARGGQIVGLVARRGALLTAGGLVVGLGAAALLARSLSSLAFEIAVTDVSVFALVAGLIGAVSCVAVALPAWRATRVNPIEALRTD